MKALVLAVLLFVSGCLATKGKPGLRAAAATGPKALQPWLQGLTAVVGFLLIVFAALIINRLLKNKRDKKKQETYEKAEDPEEDDLRQTSL